MDIIIALLIGVVSGSVSSFLFYMFLRGLKPDIEISPWIARCNKNGNILYHFKIVNNSNRPLIDVRANLSLAENTCVGGGEIYRTTEISLIRDHCFELGPFSLKDIQADYALRFATKVNIDSDWKRDSDHIRLRVIATDSVSGFSKAFVQKFMTKRNSIKDGLHEYGPSLEVS